jgi:hypothetical protein
VERDSVPHPGFFAVIRKKMRPKQEVLCVYPDRMRFKEIKERMTTGFRITLALTAFAVFSYRAQEEAVEDAPIIASATYQHTQYNGRSQAVEVSAAKDGAPFVITYFRSEEDLALDRNGSAEPPVEVGDYYARIQRPPGGGYRQGKNIKIEYHIQKAFIDLIADPVQRFSCDGKPKEITART